MAEHVFSKLITLKFNGPPPQPVAPVSDLTPEEQFKRHLEEQGQRSKEAQEDAVRTREQAGKESTMMGKLGKHAKSTMTQLSDATAKTHSSIETTTRDQLEKREKSQFQTEFPTLAQTAEHKCAYTCKAMHSGQKMEGTLYVASTHIAFAAKGGVKEEIPLADIASVQPSLALKTSKAGDGKEDGPPYIMPVPDPVVQGDCIQIFARSGNLYQFLEFDNMGVSAAQHATSTIKGNAYDRCYNWLDHTWRAATPVPAPDVQYFGA
eukprot:TRINITY_DN14813_c0_g1_i1.p2 TRINITY_DN14813_c0_g1~~TRINITY_DN14813_c0_g1_i1.p2  ORF type:complete len:264 (+),score=80.91 TRINITY_DN14813_c0_g1_i1:117-908(+)